MANPLKLFEGLLFFFRLFIAPKINMEKRNNALPRNNSQVSENFLSFKKNITGMQYKMAEKMANLLK